MGDELEWKAVAEKLLESLSLPHLADPLYKLAEN